MPVAGIICEYNPFHLGHARQLARVRETLGAEAAIVCLMSGNYVQRGEPAVFDKCVRARAAIDAGASLVVELPVTAVLQSAEGFAREGVRILSQLGCGYLSFGCESDGEALVRAADASLSPEFEQALREELQQGLSYAAARQRALAALGADGALLTKPNDILAFEYCRAIRAQQSAMRPLPIDRPGDYHAETPDEENPSATAVRKRIVDGGDWRRYVPASCAYANAAPHALSWGARAMLARLRSLEKEDWQLAAHGSEGLWSKVWKAVWSQPDYESILAAAKSKRYPRTRLQRLFLCAYLGIDAVMLQKTPPYVRVLAFDARGQAVLRAAKKEDRLTLVNAGETPPDAAYFALERRAADLYTLFSRPDAPCHAGTERLARVYRKNEKDGGDDHAVTARQE